MVHIRGVGFLYNRLYSAIEMPYNLIESDHCDSKIYEGCNTPFKAIHYRREPIQTVVKASRSLASPNPGDE